MKNILTYKKFINESITDLMKPKSIEELKKSFINLMGSFSNPLTNYPNDDTLKLDKVAKTLNEDKSNLHLISEWDDEYNTVSEIFEVIVKDDNPIIFETEESGEYGTGKWKCYPNKKLALYIPEVFDEGSTWVFNKEYFKKYD